MATRKRRVHRAFVEERRDEDTYSGSSPMPGRVWFVATCCSTGAAGYGLVDEPAADSSIDEALFFLNVKCNGKHVLA